MPRGRSTFTKRQKEQARQQKQRDKLARKSERKQEERPEISEDDQMRELHEHAAAQAALFQVGSNDSNSTETTHGDNNNGADR